MNTKHTSKKNLILGAAIVVIVTVAMFYFFGKGPAEDTSLLKAEPSSEAAMVGARVLSLLTQIKSLQIDTDLFLDPAYRTLRDYSVVVPPQNVGRPNPFAPLSSNARSSSATTSSGA